MTDTSGRAVQLGELARRIRINAIRMVAHANASHIGTALSMADILAVLYGAVLKIDPKAPDGADRDRLVVSKGHGAAALYAALAETGFFPVEWLDRYCDDHQPLAGHVARSGVPGVEVATGSLGHGLSIALGMAIAARSDGLRSRSFVLLSDGELDEGSTWEAVMLAGHMGVGNLLAIVDCNGIQSFGRVSDVLDLEPLAEKWSAFRWDVVEVDGHDVAALIRVLGAAPGAKPRVVLARTVKGKGVSFMQDRLEWHYRSPKGDDLSNALAELGEPA
jgi:transketolase